MNGLSLAPTIIACELEAGFCRAQVAPRTPGADKTSSRLKRSCAGHSGGILGNLVLSVCLLGI